MIWGYVRGDYRDCLNTHCLNTVSGNVGLGCSESSRLGNYGKERREQLAKKDLELKMVTV